LRRGLYRRARQPPLVDVDARPARLIPARLKKMNPAIAIGPVRLGPRRLTDLLSSGSGAGVKSKRNAMEQQQRSDEDQQLVARTQEGDASAFDQLVVKYTPRLYGLVYNMTSNHEDTNDLLQDIFAKAYKA